MVLAVTAAGIAACAGCRSPAGRPRDVQAVKLNDFGGYLEFVARDRRREQQSKVGAGQTKAKETIFEENLKLEVDGYTYHPNFLEFSLGGLFGLIQSQYEQQTSSLHQSSSDDGDVLEFDLSGDFFQKKKYPGTVFARRYRSLVPRPFLPSIETTTTNFGLIWRYVDEKTPTTVQFSRTEVTLDPLGSDEPEGRHEDTIFQLDTEYRFADNNVLSFKYRRDSLKEEPFALDYESDEFTLSHRLDFGQRRQHRLESELNYFDQRGTFNTERLRWREILRLQHTEDLRSWYEFEAEDRTQGSLAGVPPIEERSYQLAGTVEHKLYESLVSQFSLFGQRQDFQRGLSIDRLGAQAAFDYRKKNRAGVLLANYRTQFQTEDRTGGQVLGDVVDEPHTFRDPEPIVLTNPDIVASSIVITGEDRFTFYQVGRDYLVRRVGDRVEIERRPTGLIQDGQTVLIDYTFRVGGDLTLDTVTQDVGLRQDFSFGLSPYYRLRWQDQTISPPFTDGAVAEDITAHILGMEFRRGPVRLVGEYEDHESTITPFEAIRLTGDYTHRFEFGATGVVKARWSRFDYQPPLERQTRFFTVEGRYRHPITTNLMAEGMVLFRDTKDSLSGDDRGVDVDLSLEWLIRETEVRVTYEFGEMDDTFATNEYQTLYVQVRRSF